MVKFDVVVGNPPYQEDTEGTSAKQIYPMFMDAAYDISDKTCLITPGRFLFNAGKTSKKWNEKMLNDEYFKVLYYEQDSSVVFSNTDIKGGIAVTYRNSSKKIGKIGTFVQFEELRNILQKVTSSGDFSSIKEIIYSPLKFNLERLYRDYPHYKDVIGSAGRERRLTTSIFTQLDLFLSEKNNSSNIEVKGVIDNKRITKYIDKDYIDSHQNLYSYKVILPKANGSGVLGEVLSTPLVVPPSVGHTQTFISLGVFDTQKEAEACLNYIKTKFARIMLGTLKITQSNATNTWSNVPLQDFTKDSDIDWSKSIAEIDQQLYEKYGLSEEEITFIETHVKEMD